MNGKMDDTRLIRRLESTLAHPSRTEFEASYLPELLDGLMVAEMTATGDDSLSIHSRSTYTGPEDLLLDPGYCTCASNQHNKRVRISRELDTKLDERHG